MNYLLYNLDQKEVFKKTRPFKSAIMCLDCGWIGISYSVHDYKSCKCPNGAMIDGGNDYTRYGAVNIDRILLCDIKPSPIAKTASSRKKKAK